MTAVSRAAQLRQQNNGLNGPTVRRGVILIANIPSNLFFEQVTQLNQAQRRRTDFGLAVLGGADPTIPIAEFAQDSFNIYSKPEIYNNDETKRRLILNGGTLAIGLGLLASEERGALRLLQTEGESAAPRESMFNSGLRTTEPASESLLRAVEG